MIPAGIAQLAGDTAASATRASRGTVARTLKDVVLPGAGSTSFENVLKNETLRIGISGDGPLSSRALSIPDSLFAQRHLGVDYKQKIESSIRGVLAPIDDASDATELATFSLSFTERGEIANTLVDGIGSLDTTLSAEDAQYVDDVADMIKGEQMTGQNLLATYLNMHGGNITLRTSATFTVMNTLGARDLVSSTGHSKLHNLWAISHELEHAITPSNVSQHDKLYWVEEARADVLSWLRLHTAAKNTNIKFSTKDLDALWRETGYRQWNSSLVGLGNLAGMSERYGGSSAEFASLLRTQSEEGVLRMLGQRIAERHGADPSAVTKQVLDVDGVPERVAELAQTLGRSVIAP